MEPVPLWHQLQGQGHCSSANSVGTTLAAALEVTRSLALQLTCVSDHNDFAVHPHPTGSVRACTWQLWVSCPSLDLRRPRQRLRGFPEDARLPPVFKTLGRSLSLSPAPRLLAPLVYGAQAETGRHMPRPTHLWPCWLCNQSLVQAFSQDSNDFLLTDRPVVSGPWVVPWAPHALWVAQMSCQGLGPGQELPVSVATGTHLCPCMSVEGPFSTHSGSSQLPTALSTGPSKEDQGTGISPHHQCMLFPSHFLALCLVPGHCRAQLRDCSGRRVGSCHCFLAASSLTYLDSAFAVCSPVFPPCLRKQKAGKCCAVTAHDSTLSHPSHHLPSSPLSEWAIVFGAISLAQRGPDVEVRRIKRLIIHENYVPHLEYNDMALVELDRPVRCRSNIQTACLPGPSVKLSDMTNCYVAGWGDRVVKCEFP